MNTLDSLIEIAKKYRSECRSNICLTNSSATIRGYLSEIDRVDVTLSRIDPDGSHEALTPKIQIEWLPAKSSLVARDLSGFKDALIELSPIKSSKGNLFLPIKRVRWDSK